MLGMYWYMKCYYNIHFYHGSVSSGFAETKCVLGVQIMGVLETFGQKWCKLEKVSHRLSKASKEQLTETFTMPIVAYEKYIHHANSSSKWKFTLDLRYLSISNGDSR